jgi:uncharacterized protein (TIGR03083 family)
VIMEPVGPIDTASLFRPLHNELIYLLHSLSETDWSLPTVCKGWEVRDIATHLLDVQIRRLSFSRDQMEPPHPEAPIETYQDLVGFLNRLNADWNRALRRASPRVLVDLLAVIGPQLAEHMERLDPEGIARFSVAWAGEETSQNWFDAGREYTELWHHQQQIRDAVAAPPLTARNWLHPVLDIFIRVLPHAWRDVPGNPADLIEFTISGEAGGLWSLAFRENQWKLLRGNGSHAVCRVSIDQDSAWRLFTKGLNPEAARNRVRIEGREELGSPFLRALAIMA